VTLDEARTHIGDPVIYHPPAYAVGEVRAGVIVRVCDSYEGPYVIVRYEGLGHDRAARADHLTLMRGGGVREHFRLNLAEAGFPMAQGEEV
jgi:hypothetical protein